MPYDSRVSAHDHEKGENWHSDNAVDGCGEYERFNGVQAYKVQKEAKKHRRNDHRIKALGLPRFSFEAGRPAECFSDRIRGGAS